MTRSPARCPACSIEPRSRHHACQDGGLWCPGNSGRGAVPGWRRTQNLNRACEACGAALGATHRLGAALFGATARLIGVLLAFGGLFVSGLLWLAQEPSAPASRAAQVEAEEIPSLVLSAQTSPTFGGTPEDPSAVLDTLSNGEAVLAISDLDRPSLTPTSQDEWALDTGKTLADATNTEPTSHLDAPSSAVFDIRRLEVAAERPAGSLAFSAAQPAPSTIQAPPQAAANGVTAPAAPVVAVTSSSQRGSEKSGKDGRGGRNRDTTERDAPRLQFNIQIPGAALSLPLRSDGRRD